MLLKRASHLWVAPSLLFLAAACGVAGADTLAADNLDTSYSFSSFFYGVGFAGNTPNGPFSNETPAQEFTALAGGTITTLTATVDQFQPQGVLLNVSILNASGGLPTT